ncbi:Starch-binding associating with outer membrane [Lutibacter oricola]|uniref:Starch-binding associating with outer membrane n=1 Tax=Lutibacter oricola TaxID=762486 RepID=A0A1H3A406_9FLAO|nr:RagB/SusD family nutrient uptake outer membrane protein [Lutibacter oricola]SDX24417.1 Starch-binding associating with outer membrane [Lutibacter oricola]
MKNYKSYIIGLIALVGALQSCVKDSYLEEVNPNAVSSDNYWSNLTESEENLTSVYGGLLNQYLWNSEVEALRSDLAFPRERTRPLNYGYEWHSQSFTNTISTHYFKSWNALYRVIWRANQVIDGLNGMDETFKSQERWTTQMAEARFMRGLMHFYAHSTYNHGEIIIRDKIPTSSEEFSKPLSTSEEAIEFFRTDLQFAYDNLPNTQTQKTRVSKGTAATVLGKSYLYTEEYDLAMPLLKDVIEGPYGYSLLTGDDVSLLFTHAGDYNAESILEINYTDQHARLIQTTDSWDEEAYTTRWARYTAPTNLGGGGTSYFVPTSWLTYEYSNEPVNPNDSRNYISGTNIAKSVPLRCAQMIAVVNDEESTYYNKTPGYEATTFSGTVFSHFKKLTNHDIVGHEDEVLSTSWASGKNMIVYRLADVYLMLAECLIQKNDIDGALGYINAIRNRWGLMLLGADDGTGTFNDVTYTKETLMDHLMYLERPLEIGLEGYAERANDLRRWGVTKQRFEALAAKEYNVVNYNYTKADGTTGKGSLIQEGPTVNVKTDVNTEFDDAAVNFIESVHAYLPLPTDEYLYNQEVN